MNIKIASVDSVIIYFSETISKETSLKVKSAYKYLKELKEEGLIELIPSYTSLYITYDIFKFDFDSIKFFLENSLKKI